MAWHDCKLRISASFCLHSGVFTGHVLHGVRFAHSKQQCPKPRYYLLSGCTEQTFWGEIFFRVVEFIGFIHCFVRLWKLFEHEAIEMIFFPFIIFLEGVSISQIWECFSGDQYLPRRKTDALFFCGSWAEVSADVLVYSMASWKQTVQKIPCFLSSHLKC